MKNKTISVVGLGYVGLPLAVLAKEKEWHVLGLDVNKNKVDAINNGLCPLADEKLAEDLKKYPIEAGVDPSTVNKADMVVIAVPTPITDDNLPDLKPLTSAMSSILPYLKSGQVVVIESTINPGVMDEVVLPLLREREDLKIDADGQGEDVLHVIHCPERINPGDEKWSVRNIPRVLGGYSDKGANMAKDYYESILEAPIRVMSSVTEAEAVKIMENTFRDINIAFINEMARSFAVLGIDIVNVIEGASTKPFAFMAHYPGNGVGGHCISVDPYYMIERARQVGFDHEFLKLARKINNGMPEYAVDLMEKGLKDLDIPQSDSKIALLGLAYKKDIDDLRESPALEIREILEKKYDNISVFDPYSLEKSTVKNLEEALLGTTVVMIGVNHTLFKDKLAPQVLKDKGVKLVIDGKNCLDGAGIAALGIPYYGIGRKYLPR